MITSWHVEGTLARWWCCAEVVQECRGPQICTWKGSHSCQAASLIVHGQPHLMALQRVEARGNRTPLVRHQPVSPAGCTASRCIHLLYNLTNIHIYNTHMKAYWLKPWILAARSMNATALGAGAETYEVKAQKQLMDFLGWQVGRRSEQPAGGAQKRFAHT